MSSGAVIASVRLPAVAGTFYPSSATRLRSEVDDFIERASPPPGIGRVFGIVAPHAGYVYSGFTAAHGYKALRDRIFETVIVVGPSHQEYFQGISVYPGEYYRTPLGDVPIDGDVRTKLIEGREGIVASVAGHRGEHSVEVQLPFLQRMLGAFSFVPVVMGDQTLELCEQLAEAIASAAPEDNVLLVASSDLSHYHPYEEACVLDQRVIELVERFEPQQLLERLSRRELEACGGGPIVAVMLAAKRLGANTAKVVHYCNSGDITGDKSAVVGYCSAILTGESSTIPPKANE